MGVSARSGVGPVRTTRSGEILRGVRCLVVEDEPLIARQLALLLRLEGAETSSTGTVRDACLELTLNVYDVVLLDLNLFGECGIAVARAARGLPSPPVIVVVTGDPGFADVEQLEELASVVLMRVNVAGSVGPIVRALLDAQRADPDGSSARSKNAAAAGGIALSPRERMFLERLEAGEVLSVETVAREVLGRGATNVGNANAVQKFVSRLRAKLASSGDAGRVIESVYGAGYLFPRARGPE